MIAETLILSVTAIVLGAFALSNAVHKRLEAPPPPEPEPEPGVAMFDFFETTSVTPCPLCGAKGASSGPCMPRTCDDEECVARSRPHLHAGCVTCKGYWLMAARTSPRVAPLPDPG